MAPDIPTFRESGLPDVVVAAHWGLYAPRGTPPALVQTLGDAFLRATREDAVKAELERRGYALVDADAAAHGRILREEFEKWGGVMRRAGNLPPAR
jgi:tripartite-type tricarboxylate transporter receptor subunit TctC